MGDLLHSLVDEVKSFAEPLTKLNKRQAVSQGVNLGAFDLRSACQ